MNTSNRTPEEIQLAIATFNKELEVVPQFNFFNDDNYESIHLMIDVLKKGLDENDLYDRQEEEGLEQHTIDGAMGVLGWLDGTSELTDIIWNPESIVTELIPTDKTKMCPSQCGECPFSNKSLRGWLADYTIQDFIDMVSAEISFPCHKMMPKGDSNSIETKEAIERGEMKLCRGYIESIIKSAKMPYRNEQIVEAVKKVKEEGLSENSMNLVEFSEYHNIKKQLA